MKINRWLMCCVLIHLWGCFLFFLDLFQEGCWGYSLFAIVPNQPPADQWFSHHLHFHSFWKTDLVLFFSFILTDGPEFFYSCIEVFLVSSCYIQSLTHSPAAVTCTLSSSWLSVLTGSKYPHGTQPSSSPLLANHHPMEGSRLKHH